MTQHRDILDVSSEDMEPTGRLPGLRLTAEERFWSRVNIDNTFENDACWDWLGCKDAAGYGFFRDNRVQYRAHRYSMMLARRAPIPDGHVVCHRCDNPSCVRPSHLFVATQTENIADRDRKGRQVSISGEASPRAKLTYEQANQIRVEYASGGIGQRALARKYGVAKCAIQKIVNGKSYPTPEILLRRTIRKLIKRMGPEKATWWISYYLESEKNTARTRQ